MYIDELIILLFIFRYDARQREGLDNVACGWPVSRYLLITHHGSNNLERGEIPFHCRENEISTLSLGNCAQTVWREISSLANRERKAI